MRLATYLPLLVAVVFSLAFVPLPQNLACEGSLACTYANTYLTHSGSGSAQINDLGSQNGKCTCYGGVCDQSYTGGKCVAHYQFDLTCSGAASVRRFAFPCEELEDSGAFSESLLSTLCGGSTTLNLIFYGGTDCDEELWDVTIKVNCTPSQCGGRICPF